MHIMLDEASTPPRIKILNIAEWSPLQAHVLPGDTLEAIDRVPCNTLTFEQVPIFARKRLHREPRGFMCIKPRLWRKAAGPKAPVCLK